MQWPVELRGLARLGVSLSANFSTAVDVPGDGALGALWIPETRVREWMMSESRAYAVLQSLFRTMAPGGLVVCSLGSKPNAPAAAFGTSHPDGGAVVHCSVLAKLAAAIGWRTNAQRVRTLVLLRPWQHVADF
jgi:hypothetical protein